MKSNRNFQLKVLFSGILSLLFFVSASSQTDAILWKVSGNGLKKPSYIFGTIHLYCDNANLLKPSLMTAFNSTDVAVMELDLGDYDVLVSLIKASMKPAEKPLSSLLTKKQYELVDSVCLALLKDSLYKYDNKTPMALLSLFYGNEAIIGCKEPMPVDMTISELARKNGKQTFGLESFEFQDSILKSLPDSVQVNWLMNFCKNINTEKGNLLKLISIYSSQESSKLYEYSLKTSPEMAYFEELLLTDRNTAWVGFMKDNMPTNSLFMAVGAAHLGGKLGLIQQLKSAGYTLTPISIK